MVISFDAAVRDSVAAVEIEAIAAWHDEMAERLDGDKARKDRDRHEVMSIRLWKLARQLRSHARLALAA
jgi:hypothetical protein